MMAQEKATAAVFSDKPELQVHRLELAISGALQGKPEAVRLAVVTLLAGGHVLVEDVPGVGKTTLGQAIARALDLSFQRIQCTSDLLPADILGVSIYRQATEEFEFVPGPIFAGVVLADEINRSSPKTQSALLEAMSERQVTVERERHRLPRPFFLIATQNPHEFTGTFPLPESQLDRFMMTIEIGYPSLESERDLLSLNAEDLLASVEPVVDGEGLEELQRRARAIVVAEKLSNYILRIVGATRGGGEFALGVSTRGAQDLYRAVQAWAFCEGRSFAIPDDVQTLAPAVFGHRVAVRGEVGVAAGRAAVERVLRRLPVPI